MVGLFYSYLTILQQSFSPSCLAKCQAKPSSRILTATPQFQPMRSRFYSSTKEEIRNKAAVGVSNLIVKLQQTTTLTNISLPAFHV